MGLKLSLGITFSLMLIALSMYLYTEPGECRDIFKGHNHTNLEWPTGDIIVTQCHEDISIKGMEPAE